MSQEVIYQDGSMSEFGERGGSSHSGNLAIERIRLITAKIALETYIKFNGEFQITRNGAQKAIKNVIEPLTGLKYKRSMNGKIAALEDCIALLNQIEYEAVVYEESPST
jgi:hypothetical protein